MLNIIATDSYNINLSTVKVMKREETEDGRVKIYQIHSGIVVAKSDSALQVFNPARPDQGGDTAPQNSEWFAAQSKNIWCEKIAERTSPFKYVA
jgi:hypothetical protein